MEKKKIIILEVFVILLAVLFGYFSFFDKLQETKLENEIKKVYSMINNSDTDKIEKRLNKTVTFGDYAKVERAFKDYTKDVLDIVNAVNEANNDEQYLNILTVDNYSEDGPDFVNTLDYIDKQRSNVQNIYDEYNEIFSEEKAMSYINEKKLDDDFVALYLENYDKTYGDSELYNDLYDTTSDIQNTLSLDQIIIEFLVNNQNAWDIAGGQIVFSNDEVSQQYYMLIS